MNDIQVKYPWLTDNQNKIINAFEELSKAGTPTQREIAAKLEMDYDWRPSEQYIGRILKKHKQKKYEAELVEGEGKPIEQLQKDITDRMHNLGWQAGKRDEWIGIIEDEMQTIRDESPQWASLFQELETKINGLTVDPIKDRALYIEIKAIRQLLTNRRSPLNMYGRLEMGIKGITTMNGLMNSQNDALYKLIMAQKNILTTNFEDLPDEKQKEIMRSIIKNVCQAKCPGNSYREQEILRKKKQREEDIRRNRLGKETIVDVEYGDVDE